jgi:ubiquinone/menaquinone biosynthesis C-methylase UbiE
MGFYDRWILPPVLDFVMRQHLLAPYRRRVVAAAQGEVIEIGVGSGPNLPLYAPGQVTSVRAIDPSPALLKMARQRQAEARVPVALLEGLAEALSFEDRRFDSAVVTWALCTIPDPARALGELRRVLKPGGVLCFVEHGRAPEPAVERWQGRLTPLWRRCAGGCHLDRPIERLIRDAGFEFDGLATGYMNALKPFTFMYEGTARSLNRC